MSKQFTREEVLERLQKEIRKGRPILVAGAGIGITAKFAELGGADLIGVYNCFSGVMNFPTVGSLDGNFRRRLEDLGMGYEKEVEMIRQAREMDLFTMCYAYNPQEAEAMAEADVDVLIAHMGLTTGGSLGSKRAAKLEEAVPRVQEILNRGKGIKKDIICLAHGGPISSPEDTEYIYQHTDAVGFLGASSIERIPVERAIQSATEAFKSKPLKKRV